MSHDTRLKILWHLRQANLILTFEKPETEEFAFILYSLRSVIHHLDYLATREEG